MSYLFNNTQHMTGEWNLNLLEVAISDIINVISLFAIVISGIYALVKWKKIWY